MEHMEAALPRGDAALEPAQFKAASHAKDEFRIMVGLEPSLGVLKSLPGLGCALRDHMKRQDLFFNRSLSQ